MGEPAAARAARPGLALLGVMAAVFLAAMESTCVATAMPTVVAGLGGIRIYSWVFSAFLLAGTVAMPVWGRLADQLGRRTTFLAGLLVFLAGSALSGLAQSMPQLIVFRAVQGLGAGSIYPVGMTIVGDLYGLERRARMQGYFSSVWGLASLLGPLLGGLVADHLSWRWVFYINLPPGLLAVLAIARGLAGDERGRRPRLDRAGMALFSLAIASLLLGLIEGGRRAAWLRLESGGLLAAALILLVLFVRVERRAPEPLIPLALFRIPMVRAAGATGLLSSMAMFGAIAYVPLYLQAVVGHSATQAGFLLTPFVLAWTVCSIAGARLSLRFGYRGVVVGGMAALAAAFFLFTGWTESVSRLAAARDVALAGVGMGLVFVPMLIAVQAAVPRAHLGAATSMTSFSRSVGGAVGVAIMGSVMAQRLQAELGGALLSAPAALRAQLGELAAHPDVIVGRIGRSTVSPEALAAVRGALDHALDGVFAAGLVIALVALASAFLVPPGQARELAANREPAPGSR
jgi:EmrB/QacA subfamily drug resistance transporter